MRKVRNIGCTISVGRFIDKPLHIFRRSVQESLKA
jgi:hypothetical protein